MTKQLNLFGFNTPLARKIINPRLGLPYKGAKRKIASKLMQVMAEHSPQANYFYDLFGGGASMSLCAFANGYNVTYNELSKQTFLYFDLVAIQSSKAKGKYGILPDNYYQFVSKEEFDKIKAEVRQGKHSHYNSFVMAMYSFGNDCHSYLCDKDKEILKRMAHYLILDNSKECAEFWDTYFNERGSVGGMYDYMQKHIYPALTWHARRLIFRDMTLKLEAIRVAQMWDKLKDIDFDTLKNMTQKALCRMIDEHNPHLEKKNYKTKAGLCIYKGLEGIENLQQVEQLERLQQVEQLENFKILHQTDHLERLQNLEKIEKIERLNLTYDAVPIQSKPSDTIIYLDPPYINTSDYKPQSGGGFNHNAFYQWCIDKAKQGYNVFISEYAMPEDRFKCVYSKEVVCVMRGAHHSSKRTEKLFNPIV